MCVRVVGLSVKNAVHAQGYYEIGLVLGGVEQV